ncbi:MAG: S41 family peptidase [Stellaceae bacterium]
MDNLLRRLSLLLGMRGYALIAFAGIAALVACGVRDATSAQSQFSDARDAAVISDVMKRVERYYVVPVDRAKLVGKALNGMLSGLDPHSGYLDPTEYGRLKSDMEGQFAGLGMQITEQNGLPQVLAPIDDTPAARAGIEPGDRIVKIDGQATPGMTLDDVVTRLRGNVGSSVRLTLERTDRPPFDVTLTRAIIQVRSVKSALQSNGVGYVRISSFVDNTQDELKRAIVELKRQAGGRLTGFVLDLREDPGGELRASVDVAGDFLGDGPVVSTRARDRSEDHVYMASGASDLIKNVPMVVLIDGASASASEIVAGALQDRHRAVLMGTRSFGKGSVQSIVPLDSGGALRITTALYYTPSGRSIQGTGLQPDVVVSVPKEEAVANALVLRESDFFGALQNPGTGQGQSAQAQKPASPDLEYPIKPSLIATAQDSQLRSAVQYLQSHAVKGPTP